MGPRCSALLVISMALALMSCHRNGVDSLPPTLACGELPQESWRQLCERLEPGIEQTPGHGQVFGRRTWHCTDNTVMSVLCATPVKEDEVTAMLAFVSENAERSLATVSLQECLDVMRFHMKDLASDEPRPASATLRMPPKKKCPQ
jgi:hypothetical protein